MLHLWPRMAYEAPHTYVSFVERHIDALRRDAATVVGDERDADRLYPEVLTDVAARWRWLELARVWLGLSGLADEYLRRAFARRSTRWHNGQFRSEEMGSAQRWGAADWAERWGAADWDADPLAVEVTVWAADKPAPLWSPLPPPAERRPASVRGVSTAERLAPLLLAPQRRAFAPIAEAAVAWWHAYEAWRRRWVIVAGVVMFLLIALAGRTASGALDTDASAGERGHPLLELRVVQVAAVHDLSGAVQEHV